MSKFKIFVDGDGTLVKFDKEKNLFEISQEGYFKNLAILGNMANAMKILSNTAEIFLVSAVLPYSHVIRDKNDCYDRITPFIDKKHRIYVAYNESKVDHVKKCGAKKGDIFIDDYSDNLHEVEKSLPVIPIKALNGINGTHGTWHGAVVNVFSTSNTIANTILGLNMVQNN